MYIATYVASYVYIEVLNCCCLWIVGIAEYCNPNFRIEVSRFTVSITAPNGMCSYGIGNVGTYISSFASTEIADQAFNNPAGQYNYSQLLGQAMSQAYIVTDLFENSDIPESLFSTFLPDESMPTTEFLSASAPIQPPGGGSSATSFVFSCSLMAVLAYSILALLL